MWSYTLVISSLLVSTVLCFPEGRVVNGTNTEIARYPFVVSLRGSRGSHSCGASILDEHWILTAAHCVSGSKPESLSIQYASDVLDPNTPNQIKVKRIIIHEDYSPARNYANDIALLQLEGERGLIANGKTIAPVQLPEPFYEINQVPQGEPGVLIGWGLNATGGSVQKKLQRVDLKLYSDEECQLRHNNNTSKDNICGGVDEGGKGQCSGDSGGPLLNTNNVQLGIVSWSIKPCTIAPYPGVYTKVSHYVDWIRTTISINNGS